LTNFFRQLFNKAYNRFFLKTHEPDTAGSLSSCNTVHFFSQLYEAYQPFSASDTLLQKLLGPSLRYCTKKPTKI